MKKPLKERMEEASLHELMPGFDKEAEWLSLSGRLHTPKRKYALTWRRAAAILLLFSAGGYLVMITAYSSHTGRIAAHTTIDNWASGVLPPMPEPHSFEQAGNTNTQIQKRNALEITKAGNTGNIIKKQTQPALQPNDYRRTREFVCNGTPCPLEICIIQTIYCKGQQPTAIATCNTLEPDQARQLHYKAPDGAGAQCKVTIDEIRIKRVTTGETIVLNAHSKPSTAEELFNCITGREKCGLLAGIFEADCNNQQKTHSLKIDNNSGNLIMQ